MATGTVESAVAVRVEENRDNEKSVDREKVDNISSFSHKSIRILIISFTFQTCPLLLRVFCAMGRHHGLGDYILYYYILLYIIIYYYILLYIITIYLGDYARGSVPANELQIYTW